MRWVAVITLSLFGLVEFLLRAVMVFALVVSVLGLLLLLDEPIGYFMKPYCFELAARVAT